MLRDDLKKLIVKVVQSDGPCLTAKQIASRVGRSKSPHFVGVLAEMCEDEILIVQWAKSHNGLDTRYFSTQEQAPCLGI